MNQNFLQLIKDIVVESGILNVNFCIISFLSFS
jgi:hypothetical protein